MFKDSDTSPFTEPPKITVSACASDSGGEAALDEGDVDETESLEREEIRYDESGHDGDEEENGKFQCHYD